MDFKALANEFRVQVDAELNKEGVNEVLAQLQTEISSREPQFSCPRILNWDSKKDLPDSSGLQPPEGSIVLYWGTKRSGIIKELEYAFMKNDVELLNNISERLIEEQKNRKVVSVAEAADMLRQSPVWFDVRYGGKTLAQNLWLTDVKIGTMMFPYNGGNLQDSDFRVVDYFKDKNGQVSPYDVLLVKSPPKLTKLEAAALSAVPADMLEMNISNAGTVFATPAALVVVVVFAAINTCICGLALNDKLSQVSLSDSQIRRLGAVSSARELLAMRSQIFEEFGIR